MIYGIGTDIVKIARIKNAVDKWGDRFLRRIWTENEIAYCHTQKDPFPSLAARFAAKEAVIKALSSDSSASLIEIEVVRDIKGKPGITTSGATRNFMISKKIGNCHLSLSHEQEFAIAYAILELTP
ncbi:MAG: holo-ACP synthase [Nitrospira sp.]|nr:holo-ACP synthase [bacterium]MBL7031725.1 holo-ACP synthase [Nitrospira sp.]